MTNQAQTAQTAQKQTATTRKAASTKPPSPKPPIEDLLPPLPEKKRVLKLGVTKPPSPPPEPTDPPEPAEPTKVVAVPTWYSRIRKRDLAHALQNVTAQRGLLPMLRWPDQKQMHALLDRAESMIKTQPEKVLKLMDVATRLLCGRNFGKAAALYSVAATCSVVAIYCYDHFLIDLMSGGNTAQEAPATDGS